MDTFIRDTTGEVSPTQPRHPLGSGTCSARTSRSAFTRSDRAYPCFWRAIRSRSECPPRSLRGAHKKRAQLYLRLSRLSHSTDALQIASRYEKITRFEFITETD